MLLPRLKTILLGLLFALLPSIRTSAQHTAAARTASSRTETAKREIRNTITGRIIDRESGQALGYATIVAVNAEGEQVASAISYPDGRFTIRPEKAGDYTLWFTFVGYGSRSMAVTCRGKGIELGEVALTPGVEVEGVEIKARQLIRREPDRLVYDVSADPDARRMKMMDIMSKIPELQADAARQGKLAYNNEPVTKLLIDNRENGMINVSRQYPMNFIQADYMSKIELILPGSPEFHNDTPILLITLDRALPYGFSGQLDANASTRGDLGSGVDLVANTPWTGIGVNYKFGYTDAPRLSNRTLREMLDTESPYRTLENESSSRNTSMNHRLGLNLFRSVFHDAVDLNLSVNTVKIQSDSYGSTHSRTLDAAGAPIRTTTNGSHGHSDSPMRFNAGFSMSQKWGKGSRKRNFYTLKYTYNDTRKNTLERMNYAESDLGEELRHVVSTDGSRTHNLDFRIQLVDRNRRWNLRGDAGYIDRHYDNATDYQRYDPESGIFQSEAEQFDGLDYRQQITFARVMFLSSLFKKRLSYNLTLHGENLRNKGTFLSTGNSKLDYSQFNLLPQAALSLRLGKYFLNGSYGTSVHRPNINQLNPYVDRTDPENLRLGNPHLRGEYTHTFGGSVAREFPKWIRRIILRYGYSFTDNAIEQITRINDENISVTSYENIGRSETQLINLFVNLRPLHRLSINLSGSYSNSRYRLSDGSCNVVNNFLAQASATATLWGTSIYMGCIVKPAYMTAQSRNASMYAKMELAISRYFKKPHLGFSIWCTDLLHGSKEIRAEIASPQFIQRSYRQQLGRTFQFSVYWQFGKYRNREAVQAEAYDARRTPIF